MDITAEEYYDNNLESYNLLNKIDPMTAKQAMRMMEAYHQAKLKLLGIANVVGQSEQCRHDSEPIIDSNGVYACPDCGKYGEDC